MSFNIKQILEIKNIKILYDKANDCYVVVSDNRKTYFTGLETAIKEVKNIILKNKIVNKAPYKDVNELISVIKQAMEEIDKDLNLDK